MDDTLIRVVMALAIIIVTWTNLRTSSAHAKIDNERKDNEARINLLHAKIKSSDEKTEHCRMEIQKDLDTRMTEVQIKDFVDRSITAVIKLVEIGNKATDKVDGKVDNMAATVTSISVAVQSLADKK